MNASSSSRRSRLLASLCGVAAALVLLGLGWAARRLLQERRDLVLLDSKDATAARAAAARLAKLGSWRATERLVTLLRERARAAEQERQWVKEALRERLPGALVQLGAEIEDGWDEGDHAVLRFLEDLGAEAQPAVPALVRSLEAIDHEDGSFAISFALLWIDPRGYEAVRPLLRSPSVVARTNALGVLRMADAVPASYLSEVAASLDDAEPVVRTEAVWTLQSLRPDATTARAALSPRLLDEDPNARLAAACALVRLGAAGKEIVPVLLEDCAARGSMNDRGR